MVATVPARHFQFGTLNISGRWIFVRQSVQINRRYILYITHKMSCWVLKDIITSQPNNYQSYKENK